MPTNVQNTFAGPMCVHPNWAHTKYARNPQPSPTANRTSAAGSARVHTIRATDCRVRSHTQAYAASPARPVLNAMCRMSLWATSTMTSSLPMTRRYSSVPIPGSRPARLLKPQPNRGRSSIRGITCVQM